jgi:glycosyltransferase involved in cell wall biosynthesis
MKIWIIQPGEPLPVDGKGVRLLRSGLLALALRDRGHEVTWWASTFRHTDHKFRYEGETSIEWEGIEIRMIHSSGYRRNVSLSRIIDHNILGRNMARSMEKAPRPEIIHSSYPPIETSEACVRYGRRYKVPVVVDVRDMWPDAFADVLPAIARPFGKAALYLLELKARKVFTNAAAIHGHAPGFRDFGLAKASRDASSADRVYPFGYISAPPAAAEVLESERFWEARGVNRDPSWTTICMVGNLNTERKDVDYSTICHAVRNLKQSGQKVRVVFGGQGRAADNLRSMFYDIPDRVILPGYLNAAQIWSLLRRSQFGLLPYRPSSDFAKSIPNKSIEYLSAGLPILTCLNEGYLFSQFTAAGVIVVYPAENCSALVEKLTTIIADQDYLNSLKRNAQRLFDENYKAEHIYGDLSYFLEQVAKSNAEQ